MSSVMDIAQELTAKNGKPAYVQFHQVAKHLPKRSEEEGRYVAIDVDMVTVRQIGAADSSIFEVDRWLKQNEQEVAGGRLPREYATLYEKAYRMWKSGQEIPVEGTPIKGWPPITPAQVEAIIRVGIRTVEELATMNDEAMTRIGMGGVSLKQKAQAWIAQSQDKGAFTMEMAALKRENTLLKDQLAVIQERLDAMQHEKPVVHSASSDVITASDLLDPEPAPRRPGRPRKEA